MRIEEKPSVMQWPQGYQEQKIITTFRNILSFDLQWQGNFGVFVSCGSHRSVPFNSPVKKGVDLGNASVGLADGFQEWELWVFGFWAEAPPVPEISPLPPLSPKTKVCGGSRAWMLLSTRSISYRSSSLWSTRHVCITAWGSPSCLFPTLLW